MVATDPRPSVSEVTRFPGHEVATAVKNVSESYALLVDGPHEQAITL
jgi:hypothetical protein